MEICSEVRLERFGNGMNVSIPISFQSFPASTVVPIIANCIAKVDGTCAFRRAVLLENVAPERRRVQKTTFLLYLSSNFSKDRSMQSGRISK